MTSNLYETRDKWGKNQREIFDELLKEKGITEYVLFIASGEGIELPTGLESMSASIFTKDDTRRIGMIEWDLERIAPDGSKGYYSLSLTEPRVVTNNDNTEYIRARKQLNLPITEEQEKILQKWEEENNHR